MKTLLPFALIFTLTISCFSQTKFEQGYLINNENEKSSVLLKTLIGKTIPKSLNTSCRILLKL